MPCRSWAFSPSATNVAEAGEHGIHVGMYCRNIQAIFRLARAASPRSKDVTPDTDHLVTPCRRNSPQSERGHGLKLGGTNRHVAQLSRAGGIVSRHAISAGPHALAARSAFSSYQVLWLLLCCTIPRSIHLDLQPRKQHIGALSRLGERQTPAQTRSTVMARA